MDNVDTAELLIRLGAGLCMLAFGMHQLRRPEAWLRFIPRPIRFLMPFKPASFMRVHGVGNMLLGLLLITGLWHPVSTWLVLAWWVFVTPFAFYADFTMGLRDIAIVMSVVALLLLG